jgi:hypothetical protein
VLIIPNNMLNTTQTGILDVRQEESLREWSPEQHFCVTALLFLKKVFYLKSFDESLFPTVPNEEARGLFERDREAFAAKVSEAVQDSLKRIYEVPDPQCTIRFSGPLPAHDIIRETIMRSGADTDTDTDGEGDGEGEAKGRPSSSSSSGARRAGKGNEGRNESGGELDMSQIEDATAGLEIGMGIGIEHGLGAQVPKKLPFFDLGNEVNE